MRAMPTRRLRIALEAGIDRHIAFGIQAHRPVVHVGRADMQHLVVHDHQLGMDIDRLAAGRHRMIQAQAPLPIEPAQRFEQARAGRIHGDRLEPAM